MIRYTGFTAGMESPLFDKDNDYKAYEQQLEKEANERVQLESTKKYLTIIAKQIICLNYKDPELTKKLLRVDDIVAFIIANVQTNFLTDEDTLNMAVEAYFMLFDRDIDIFKLIEFYGKCWPVSGILDEIRFIYRKNIDLLPNNPNDVDLNDEFTRDEIKESLNIIKAIVHSNNPNIMAMVKQNSNYLTYKKRSKGI